MLVYFFVPYAEKDDAKAMGARFDFGEKCWYADSESVASLLDERWKRMRGPLLSIPGEDRTFGGNDLFVDLIPRSCWFTNARSNIAPDDWKRVQHLVRTRVNGKCECCDSPGADVHERWEYTDYEKEKCTQTLRRLIFLCKECHMSTHMGLAQIRGQEDEALSHIMNVRKCSMTEAINMKADAFAQWRERNKTNWELNLDILHNAGIQVANTTQVTV